MNYYEILGVSSNATQDEISKSFRKLAKEYHPDLNKSFNAKSRFIEIYEAYSILKDEQKRATYDKIIFNKFTSETEKTNNNDNYTNWKNNATNEGKYYSETNFEEFKEKILKNIKFVAKTTSKILLYFLAMILVGLIGKFIISPILNAKLQNDLKNYYEERAKIIEVEKNSLPLPLPSLTEGWKRISMDGIGTIDIPPTMEIQSGIYKEIAESIQAELFNQMGFPKDNNSIIIQQKGLNDFDDNRLQKYARVLINYEIGEIDEYDTLYFDIKEYTYSDIKELDELFRNMADYSFSGTGLKIIQWFPLKLIKINGMSCIHTSYIRQLNNNPTVFVNQYMFHNVDRMYTLTISYRQNEEEYWKNDLKILLDSFRIHNIQ